MTELSITCPRCGHTSHHPQDVTSGYCGNCHDWTTQTLSIWTVYDHPADYPDMYVARLFDVTGGGDPVPTGHTFAAATLELVRAWIQQVAPGTVCLTRSPEDDPVIMESWL